MPPETQQLMEPPEYEPAEEEPPESTPESLYEELVFRPIFEGDGDQLDEAGLTPSQRAEVYQRALLNGFERQIRSPTLKDLLGNDYYSADKQTKNEIIGFPDFPRECEKKVREVAAEHWQVYHTRAIIDAFIRLVQSND